MGATSGESASILAYSLLMQIPGLYHWKKRRRHSAKWFPPRFAQTSRFFILFEKLWASRGRGSWRLRSVFPFPWKMRQVGLELDDRLLVRMSNALSAFCDFA